jgi:16S rRNA G1207 methylase RsmC
MLTKIVQGNCLETHCPVESFSLIFENPPYDWALSANTRERLEAVFLNHTFRWLIPGGVLLLVIPAERAAECAQVLASHFKRCRILRLGDPESLRARRMIHAGERSGRRNDLWICFPRN